MAGFGGGFNVLVSFLKRWACVLVRTGSMRAEANQVPVVRNKKLVEFIQCKKQSGIHGKK